MTTAPGSFSTQIRIFSRNALADLELVHRKVALDLFSRIIMRTPVDTGRARGNWQVAMDKIPTGTLEREDPGQVNQGGVGASVAKTQAEQTVLSAPFITSIVLANNLPYIAVLEYGREDGTPGSRQAPAGMVRVTVTEFEQLVRKAGGEVRRA